MLAARQSLDQSFFGKHSAFFFKRENAGVAGGFAVYENRPHRIARTYNANIGVNRGAAEFKFKPRGAVYKRGALVILVIIISAVQINVTVVG